MLEVKWSHALKGTRKKQFVINAGELEFKLNKAHVTSLKIQKKKNFLVCWLSSMHIIIYAATKQRIEMISRHRNLHSFPRRGYYITFYHKNFLSLKKKEKLQNKKLNLYEQSTVIVSKKKSLLTFLCHRNDLNFWHIVCFYSEIGF